MDDSGGGFDGSDGGDLGVVVPHHCRRLVSLVVGSIFVLVVVMVVVVMGDLVMDDLSVGGDGDDGKTDVETSDEPEELL